MDSKQYFTKWAEAAESIQVDKELILEHSKRKEALREAKRALQAEIKKEGPKDSKTWLCFGNMFIKCPNSKALTIVEKDETLIKEEINRLRDGLKPKAQYVKNLEGDDDFKFDLKPLNKNEAAAMKSILPTVI